MFDKSFSDPDAGMPRAALRASPQKAAGSHGPWQPTAATMPQRAEQAARPSESQKAEDWAGECLFDCYNN